MSELLLVVTIGGERVALPAAAVESVVELDALIPVPRAPAHVAGLSALRSRVLTIIDVPALIRRMPTPAAERGYAIIADISGHSYGLMVDAVHDICQLPEGELPLRGQLDQAWGPYARGIVEQNGLPYLLVSLASFVEIGSLAQAA